MDAPQQTEARQRLTLLIEERADELGMTWNELAEKAGLTKEGLRGVRFGSGKMRRLTKRGLEDALRWESGSVDRVLEGGEPESVRPSGPVRKARLDAAPRRTTEAIVRREEEDPFDRLDRLYAEWREVAEESEAEALRAVLESYRDRKTG